MELKPVEIKKATEERTSGESQTPFREMVEWNDFVYILHGKKLAKRRAPIDEIFSLKQTLINKIQEFVIGALTISPPPEGGCDSFPFPSFSLDLLGTISRSVCHELLGGCREGAERFG
jgi:hypothetical protein